MPVMLTYAECIAKVMEMEQRAIAQPALRDDYLQLAQHWRWVAEHAKWHEAHEDRFP